MLISLVNKSHRLKYTSHMIIDSQCKHPAQFHRNCLVYLHNWTNGYIVHAFYSPTGQSGAVISLMEPLMGGCPSSGQCLCHQLLPWPSGDSNSRVILTRLICNHNEISMDIYQPNIGKNPWKNVRIDPHFLLPRGVTLRDIVMAKLLEISSRGRQGTVYTTWAIPCSSDTRAPLPTWINSHPSIGNYIHYKGWDKLTYPFPNFNGATVEVWEWISNFFSYLTGHVIAYPYRDYS